MTKASKVLQRLDQLMSIETPGLILVTETNGDPLVLNKATIESVEFINATRVRVRMMSGKQWTIELPQEEVQALMELDQRTI